MIDDDAKLLGVQWDSETDIFQFDFIELQNFVLNLPLCKQSTLRVSAGVFGPLRFHDLSVALYQQTGLG